MNVIKIRRDSVKVNPDAGQTHFQESMGQTTTIEFFYPGLLLKKIMNDRYEILDGDVRVTGWDIKYGDTRVEAITSSGDLQSILDRLVALGIKKEKVHFNTQFHYQDVHTITPAPKYLFEYDMTSPMKCDDCDHLFKASEIVERESDYDEDYGYSDPEDLCPGCSSTIHFTHEKLADVVKELGL
jgi:hypothetical protein